jgi:hypothetical protein
MQSAEAIKCGNTPSNRFDPPFELENTMFSSSSFLPMRVLPDGPLAMPSLRRYPDKSANCGEKKGPGAWAGGDGRSDRTLFREKIQQYCSGEQYVSIRNQPNAAGGNEVCTVCEVSDCQLARSSQTHREMGTESDADLPPRGRRPSCLRSWRNGHGAALF